MKLAPVEMKLKYFETIMMPESVKDEEKGGFKKTGNKVEMTGYALFSEFGEKLYFISKESKYREYEGKEVLVTLDVSFDDYGRKNKVTLDNIETL